LNILTRACVNSMAVYRPGIWESPFDANTLSQNAKSYSEAQLYSDVAFRFQITSDTYVCHIM